MASFLYRAPSGVAGDVTRPDNTVVEPGILNAAQSPAAFGLPVKLVAGKFEKIASGNPASVFAGILSRTAPSIAGDTPAPASVQGIVTSGYVNVLCTVGTPVRGGIVYMRVTTSGVKLIGDLEATSDSTLSVALVGVTWATDGKDSGNVAEIRIK
jgi:hypothetical protein